MNAAPTHEPEIDRLRRWSGRLLADFAGPTDQVVFSLVSLSLTLAAARGSSAADFGRFAMIVLLANSGVFIARSFTGMLIAVQRRDVTGPQASTTISQGLTAVGLCAAIAIGCGVVAFPFAVIFAPALVGPLAVLLLATPFAMAEDYFRFVLFNRRRPDLALRMDLTWFGLFLGLFALGFLTGNDTSLLYVAVCWALGCLGATAVGVQSVGRASFRRSSMRLPSGTFRPGLTLALDSVFALFRIQGTFWIVFAFASAEDAGGLRLTMSLFGFVSTIAIGLRASELPVIVEHYDLRSRRNFAGRLIRMSIIVWVVAALSTAFLLLVPTDLGDRLFGGVWEYAEPLVLAVGVAQAAIGFEVAFSSSLLAMQALRLHLIAKITTAIGALGVFWLGLGFLEWSLSSTVVAAGVATTSMWVVMLRSSWYAVFRRAVRR